jgi:hypothetical protein
MSPVRRLQIACRLVDAVDDHVRDLKRSIAVIDRDRGHGIIDDR